MLGIWIKCSVRMPDKHGNYLTWNGVYIRNEFFMFNHFQSWQPEKITHWMPLPEPPEG